MTIQSRFIDVHGMRTHYLVAGDENAPVMVVLLHGGGIDNAALSWELLLPELSQSARVLAPDFPGYGESDAPDMPYSLELYVAFLTAFLDQLRVRSARFAGISMGGGVALGFALRSPERVERLALVDSYGLQRTAPVQKLGYLMIHTPGLNETTAWLMRSKAMVRASLGALLKRPGALNEALVDLAHRSAARPGAFRAWNAFQRDEVLWNGVKTCYQDRLRELSMPVLVVHGTEDTAVPVACAREAHSRIPGARLALLEGSGHWPQRDDPQGFNEVAVAFLVGQSADLESG